MLHIFGTNDCHLHLWKHKCKMIPFIAMSQTSVEVGHAIFYTHQTSGMCVGMMRVISHTSNGKDCRLGIKYPFNYFFSWKGATFSKLIDTFTKSLIMQFGHSCFKWLIPTHSRCLKIFCACHHPE